MYHPFPRRPVVIEPTFGRLVFFDARFKVTSRATAKRERFCFTVWHFTVVTTRRAAVAPSRRARSRCAVVASGLRKHLANSSWRMSGRGRRGVARRELRRLGNALKAHWDEVGLI